MSEKSLHILSTLTGTTKTCQACIYIYIRNPDGTIVTRNREQECKPSISRYNFFAAAESDSSIQQRNSMRRSTDLLHPILKASTLPGSQSVLGPGHVNPWNTSLQRQSGFTQSSALNGQPRLGKAWTLHGSSNVLRSFKVRRRLNQYKRLR